MPLISASSLLLPTPGLRTVRGSSEALELSAADDTIRTLEGREKGREQVVAQIEWLDAYVARCMASIYEEKLNELTFHPRAVVFRAGTASCQVRVEDGDPAMVRVMAQAVGGVKDSAKLLRELNELNAHSRVTNAWWSDGDVVVECSMLAETVDQNSLAAACFFVSRVANDIGVGFAALFDGTTPYPPAEMADSSDDAL